MDDLRTEIRGARHRLERETVTGPALDEVMERAEEHLARLPETVPATIAPEPAEAVEWHVGARGRSRSRGWEGRIAALERGGRRATLEVGGMRVTVGVEDEVAMSQRRRLRAGLRSTALGALEDAPDAEHQLRW